MRVKIQTLAPYPEDAERIANMKQISYKSQDRYYLPSSERSALLEQRQKLIEGPAEPAVEVTTPKSAKKSRLGKDFVD